MSKHVKALALAVWAVVLRPCCQTETALKRDYTTGIDSSSRYSANATHLNQSCYITRKIQVVTKWSAMVCGKQPWQATDFHWPLLGQFVVPNLALKQPACAQRGGTAFVKVDTVVALENESTMSLFRRGHSRAHKSKTNEKAGYFDAHHLKFAWDAVFSFFFFWFCIPCRLQRKGWIDSWPHPSHP